MVTAGAAAGAEPGRFLALDSLRGIAAVGVALFHIQAVAGPSTLPVFRNGNLFVDFFFVLSGFVIAYTAQAKEPSLGAFARSRLARLWSVAVPALILTMALDHWGSLFDPAAYSQWWHQGADPLWRAFRALSFTNELWFSSVRPFSNGPWWSLGYEAVYYALFAALFYIPGWKGRAVAGALMLLAGPKILLLAPIWWLGVWVWQRTQRETLPADKSALLFFGTIAAYALFRWSGLPVFLRDATVLALGADNVVTYLHFSDEFLSSYIIGPLVALHFIAAHGLAHALDGLLAPWRKLIVWFAQSTFALYLLHYPMLRFADAAFAYDASDPWHVAAVFLGVTGLCVVIGPVIERTKGPWKALLAPRWPRRQATA